MQIPSISSYLSSISNLPSQVGKLGNRVVHQLSSIPKPIRWLPVIAIATKSLLMIHKAVIMPRGWNLSRKEKQALYKFEDLKMTRIAIRNLSSTVESKRNEEKNFRTILTQRNAIKNIVKLINEGKFNEMEEDPKNFVEGLNQLYNRTAQLLPWSSYIKHLL